MGRHGENIRKRKDGRWEARYIQGYDVTGKAHYRYLYGKTYLEVKNKRKQEMQRSQVEPVLSEEFVHKVTFEDTAWEWLATRRGIVKESTYANYTTILENHLLPELGDLYISSFTVGQLEEFLKRRLMNGRKDGTGGLSVKTVSDIRAVLRLILRFARARGISTVADPELPAVTRQIQTVETFTKKEQVRLEKILFQEISPFHLGILISLYAGLRIGEVCALQWGDFQFEEGTLCISKTVIRIRNLDADAQSKTKVIIDRPKTICSNRVIPLPEFIIQLYQEHCKEADIYLLTGTRQFMEPRICLAKYKKVLLKAGIKDYNFHALRHTFATRCVENNFDMKSLSEIMGHANVTITLQRYVHPSMEQKREQMNKLAANSFHGQSYGQ